MDAPDDDGVCALQLVLGYASTPRDAVRLTAVSQRVRRVEPSVRYCSSMLVAASDAAALRWLAARTSRVAHARIDCTGAPLEALREAHKLSRAMQCSTQLDMRSPLFRDILETLSRDGAAMTALLKRHVNARLGGATRDGVRELDREMLNKYGYDTDHDALARASFAWCCDNPIPTGANDQLELTLHLRQSADLSDCEMRFEVYHRRSGELLKRSVPVFGDETTTDWWLNAATLYDDVKKFEAMDGEYWDSEWEEDDGEDEDDEDDSQHAWDDEWETETKGRTKVTARKM